MIKLMPCAQSPLIAPGLCGYDGRIVLSLAVHGNFFCVREMFQPKHKHLCIRPPITSGVTHLLWRISTHQGIFHFFPANKKKMFIVQ